MEFQQILVRTIWKPPKQEEKMIIKGKILNSVILKDINKLIYLGKEIELTQREVDKSEDLKNAIKRGWVEVIKGKDMFKKPPLSSPNKSNSINPIVHPNEEIMDLAKKMATTMAEEMLKNSPIVKEIAKEVAKEMILELKQNLPFQVSKQEEKISFDDNSKNIFVDFNEEDEVVANLENIGIEKTETSDISNTLKKMEKLRKKS